MYKWKYVGLMYSDCFLLVWYPTQKQSGYVRLHIRYVYRVFRTLQFHSEICITNNSHHTCTVVVVITKRFLALSYWVTKQCRVLDNHHVMFWCHTLCFTPCEFNLQVFVNSVVLVHGLCFDGINCVGKCRKVSWCDLILTCLAFWSCGSSTGCQQQRCLSLWHQPGSPSCP